MNEGTARPLGRIDLDEMGDRPTADITDRHLRNAITSTCVALDFARSRSQARSCWHALRLLLEAKFGPRPER